jgi:hypothetical protein
VSAPLPPGAAIPDYAHVLAWLPPYLISGKGGGWWDLYDRADYEAGEPNVDESRILNVAKDAPAAELESWVAGTLGYPVTLTAGTEGIRPGRLPLRRWRDEPVYYVSERTS